MALLLRTENNLNNLAEQGFSALWRINKKNLQNINYVIIYNFEGTRRITAIYTGYTLQNDVRGKERKIINFNNPIIENCNTHWYNDLGKSDNPIGYIF